MCVYVCVYIYIYMYSNIIVITVISIIDVRPIRTI